MHVNGRARPLLYCIRATNVIRMSMRKHYVGQIPRLQPNFIEGFLQFRIIARKSRVD
jgi:hypothetical protein